MTILEPLRAEHRELLPHVEHLRQTADAIGVAGAADLVDRVAADVSFLTGHLIPHARAEDAALYPVVERLLGADGATATMSREHEEVGSLTGELSALLERLRAGEDPTAMTADLRRVLYGLYAIVSVHFAEEEEVYLPILAKGLSAGEAEEMFAAMHRAAHTAG